MATEIERKFLVKGDYMDEVKSSLRISQGYLSSHPERIVRIRIKGNRAFITVKGIANNTGLSRYEWEKEIDPIEAKELLAICEPGIIDKTRHIVEFKGHVIEIDEFHAENQGLVVAEIELKSETEEFEKPEWLGEEVTGDERYYNAMLTKVPFTRW
jgi:adenylate cyclase